jgi:hypothetical protein
MHELLILSPHNFFVALVNYALLHGAYLLCKKLWESHYEDPRKLAIRHHFWDKHNGEIETCMTQNCATL